MVQKLKVRGLREFVMMFVYFSLSLSQLSCGGSSVAGGLTFGAVLSAALSHAQQMIQDAQDSGNALMLKAGMELQSTVEAAQSAYADSLDKTFLDLNDTEKKTFTDLNNLTQKITANEKDILNHTADQAQIIADTLPIHDKQPHLMDVTKYASPLDTPFEMHFVGNFPYSSGGTHKPELEIDGQRLAAIETKTLEIVFSVPASLLPPALPNKVAKKPCILHVPYDEGGLFDRVGDAAFAVSLARLPTTPGTLAVVHDVVTTTPEDDTRGSAPFDTNSASTSKDLDDSRSLDLSQDDYDAGWRIVPHSASFVLLKRYAGDKGSDWYDDGEQSENDRQVIWEVSTKHRVVLNGTSGWIRWGISVKVHRDKQNTTRSTETIPLTWGMSKIMPYSTSTNWLATWQRFDSASYDINSTDLSNILLQIDATGNSFTVKTYGF